MVNEASVTVFLRRCVAVENVNIPVPTLAGVLAGRCVWHDGTRVITHLVPICVTCNRA